MQLVLQGPLCCSLKDIKILGGRLNFMDHEQAEVVLLPGSLFLWGLIRKTEEFRTISYLPFASALILR